METQDGLYKEGNKEPFIYHPISLTGISMDLPNMEKKWEGGPQQLLLAQSPVYRASREFTLLKKSSPFRPFQSKLLLHRAILRPYPHVSSCGRLGWPVPAALCTPLKLEVWSCLPEVQGNSWVTHTCPQMTEPGTITKSAWPRRVACLHMDQTHKPLQPRLLRHFQALLTLIMAKKVIWRLQYYTRPEAKPTYQTEPTS